jgi:hypothetical protein
MRDDRPTAGGRVFRFLLRIVGFVVVVLLVWFAYVYLYAYQPDFLGRSYNVLRPVTTTMFQLIEAWFPESVKYKITAILTDELGPRALFLLILGGLSELIVVSIYGGLRSLVRAMR